jgi:hypothetical protein
MGAERLVTRADNGEGDVAAQYQEAGVAYLALAHRCVDAARAAGSTPQQERCDELAYNAGRAFLAAKQPERAKAAAKVLLDPGNGMQKSPLAAKLSTILQSTPAAP